MATIAVLKRNAKSNATGSIKRATAAGGVEPQRHRLETFLRQNVLIWRGRLVNFLECAMLPEGGCHMGSAAASKRAPIEGTAHWP